MACSNLQEHKLSGYLTENALNKLLSIYLMAALRFVNTSIVILFLAIYIRRLLLYDEKNWQKKSRDEVNNKVSSSSSKLYIWATKHHQRARMAADINWL